MIPQFLFRDKAITIHRDQWGRLVVRFVGGACNWHNHFRDPEEPGDPRFIANLPFLVQQYDYVNGMMNYAKAVRTAERTNHIFAIIKEEARKLGFPRFLPMLAPMITEETTPDDIFAIAKDCYYVYGVKTMPKHGTTNSGEGIADFYSPQFNAVLDAIEQVNKSGRRLAWLVHAEVADPSIPKGKRETPFLPIIAHHKDKRADLPVCIEHIQAKETPPFIDSYKGAIMGGITTHHPVVTGEMADHDDALVCMPYPGTPEDAEVILDAMLSGKPWYCGGGDNAPHLWVMKDGKLVKINRANGVWCAATELATICELFYKAGHLQRVGAFVTTNPSKYFGVPMIDDGQVEITEQSWQVPESFPVGDKYMVPHNHGQVLSFRLTRDAAGRVMR